MRFATTRFCVDPIVFCDDTELLERADAERELGLEPGGVNVLVQLGQGAEVRAASERCLAHLAGRDGVRVAALRSHLAAIGETPPGVVGLDSTYPMSRYLRAFDATVSAAGYNAYHELIRFGVPSLFVPMRRQTDDQEARARYAEASGVGLGVDGPGGARARSKARRAARSRRARGDDEPRCESSGPPTAPRRPPRGWPSSPRTERVRKPGTKRWKRYAAHPVASARAAAPFAARVPGAVGRIAHQTVTRPKARVLIDAGELEPERGRAPPRRRRSQASGEPPERVLVLTDRVEVLPVLRKAGVGGGARGGAGPARPDPRRAAPHQALR